MTRPVNTEIDADGALHLDPFSDREMIGAALMGTISEWARFDAYLVGILATILKTERPVAMAMFVAANNQRAQRDMLVAAAKAVLESDDLSLLKRVLDRVVPLRKERNEIAHSVWLRHHSLPNELICADPLAVGVFQGHRANSIRGPDKHKPLPVSGLEGARIWDQADVSLVSEHARHASTGIWKLWTYLMYGRNDYEIFDETYGQENQNPPERINFRTEVEKWLALPMTTKAQIKERSHKGTHR